MRNDGFQDFLGEEWRSLVGIGVVVLGVATVSVGVVRQSLPVPTYADVANLIIAYVAVTSLYLAWRELIRKTRPRVTLDFAYEYPDDDDVQERMTLKLTNSGTNVVTPANVWYGYVERSDDGYYFSNTEMSNFGEDGLEPGETAEVEIGDDIAMLRVKNLNILDWRGQGVSISEFPSGKTQNRSHVVEPGGRLQVRVQKLFDAVMESDVQLGIKYSEDKLRTSEVQDILADADWAGTPQYGEVPVDA
jgi:hypothetical protein